jgi:methylated-DNA-[protein]-cysteine S-methyltransferase
MGARGWTLFDTAVGRCGIVWGDAGIAGIQLPERDERATAARLGRRFPDARPATPPPEVAEAITAMVALLEGEPEGLRDIRLDLHGVPAFHQQVYEVTRSIPPGETLTYGEVATRLGDPGAARAVGQALGRNPFPIVVPCHRVTAAGGKLGGFSAEGGAATKRRMLAIEGAAASPPSLFDA